MLHGINDGQARILAPVHRWVMGETRLFGLHLWFRLHMALQLSGMVCFIVGFAYAWTYLPVPGNGNLTGGNVGLAHMYLGTIVMGLACLQIIIGFVRPKPDARVRPHWNMLHHWLGRLTIVSAWTTLYMGIWMAHTSTAYQASYTYWLAPIVAVMGTMLLVDICLTAYTIMRPEDVDDLAAVAAVSAVEVGGMPPGADVKGKANDQMQAKANDLYDAELGEYKIRTSIGADPHPDETPADLVRTSQRLSRRNSLNQRRVSADGRE